MTNAVAERFALYVGGDGECWEWLGGRSANGYGAFASLGNGNVEGAHRWSYRYHRGPIPAGFVVDHLCQNKGCVNPGHLEAVTSQENSRRANLKEFCKRGHPRSDRGPYGCRPCNVLKQRAYLDRKGE